MTVSLSKRYFFYLREILLPGIIIGLLISFNLLQSGSSEKDASFNQFILQYSTFVTNSMWKTLTTGFRSTATIPQGHQSGEEEGKSENIFDDDVCDDDNSRIEYAEAQLLPCEAEKKHILSMFYTMRRDSFFCDVAFVCNGVLFRAHRVVVSSWSRWLRALLCEAPDEEVVSLDFFDASAFGAALDYMYGVPLTITVENADNVLKVVRRLEMQKLEQQCWRYLMTVINPETNVEILHELADRYDCPPLKLAAWRILQEKLPTNGASLAATRLLKKGKEGMQAKLGITGLTGPGEPWFNNSIGLSGGGALGDEGMGRLNVRGSYSDVEGDEEEELQHAHSMMPSVFSELREDDQEQDEDEEDALDAEDFGSEDESYRARKEKFGWDISNYQDPSELDATASAAQIVQAWAFRLKEIYDQCSPANAQDYEDEDHFMIAQNSPHVRLTTSTYPRPGGKRGASAGLDKRSALLGEPDDASVGGPSSPSPRAQQSDPFFKLVPSSSSVGASVAAATIPGGGADLSPMGRSAPRRPPAPTASNIAANSPPVHSSKFNKWPAPGSSNKAIDWREEMKRFYIAIGMPEKIAGISTILSTWAGKEEEMLANLMEKYRTSIPTQMSAHLEQLIAHLETHTESSFVRGPAISANSTAPNLPKSPPRSARRAQRSPPRTNL